MASQKQIEANRRNAQKSTGPKTTEGKNAARFNAVQHGFTAARFLIDHEDADEFNGFREGFFAEHQPETPTETFLVEQMIAAMWRIRRIRYAEAAFWNQKMSDLEEDLHDSYKIIEDRDHLAYAVPRRSNTSIENLSRYEARIERAFYKALHELQRLRRERPPVPQIGFVSQKPQQPPKPQLVPKPEPPFQAPRNDSSLVRNRTPLESSNLTS